MAPDLICLGYNVEVTPGADATDKPGLDIEQKSTMINTDLSQNYAIAYPLYSTYYSL